jgi:D-glycero-D-manno-heptose 1,7-bisphosphate phosphatase
VIPCAVIFDRDGTIVFDVPYNGDPAATQPVPGIKAALDKMRAAKIPIGVISNQSGIARGIITADQVEAVNARIDLLIGPFDVWLYCPHGPDDGCDCRKPKPKMVLDAARAMGVDPGCCVVIGDKASDVQAARNAGAQAIFIDDARSVIDAIETVLAEVES